MLSAIFRYLRYKERMLKNFINFHHFDFKMLSLRQHLRAEIMCLTPICSRGKYFFPKIVKLYSINVYGTKPT